MTCAKRVVAVATLTFAFAIAGASLFAAQSASADATKEEAQPIEWSMKADCASCHVKEAEACAAALAANKEEADESAAEQPAKTEGAAQPEADTQKADGDKANAAEAGSKNASKADGAKASDDAQGQAVDRTAAFVTQHAAFACTVCHANEEVLADRHDGVTADDRMPKKLKKTTVEDKLCLACHVSAEDLAEKTAESQALVDGNGTVVNPHALPQIEDHAGIECIDCHTMHKGDPLEESAKDKCLSCHHDNVFECGTCH